MIQRIVQSDNMNYLPTLKGESINFIYIDPPFNTGKDQKYAGKSYVDNYTNYAQFLKPRLEEAWRLLRWSGSLFVHLDYREVHYIKVLLDTIFGRERFMNEIIWSYDYGGRSKKKWSTKHDTILWYAKSERLYTFNYDKIDRIPYMSPGLVGPIKAARGKTPTDVWWNTIVHTTGSERVGYPTQKPVKIIRRLVQVHSNPGDLLLDFFAGSGTLGAAALPDRQFILVDENPEAIAIMTKRFADHPLEIVRISEE